MIESFVELLRRARLNGKAIGAFTCYDAESAAGVLGASAGSPLILLISSRLIKGSAGELLVTGLRAMAERAESPVCLQLDHARDLDTIRTGCRLGLGAVMADGSHLSRAANVEFVLAARAVAEPLGVAVEAAIGRVDGDEEVAAAAGRGELTEPSEAEGFVLDSAPDCLAVTIGNAHGLYRDTPRLDLRRLAAIAARVDVPLALHGGSGLPATAVMPAVASGITKMNFNTELRQAYLERTRNELPAAMDGARIMDLHRGQIESVAVTAAARMAMLDASPGARPGDAGRHGVNGSIQPAREKSHSGATTNCNDARRNRG